VSFSRNLIHAALFDLLVLHCSHFVSCMVFCEAVFSCMYLLLHCLLKQLCLSARHGSCICAFILLILMAIGDSIKCCCILCSYVVK
jgi:hypothetical protein